MDLSLTLLRAHEVNYFVLIALQRLLIFKIAIYIISLLRYSTILGMQIIQRVTSHCIMLFEKASSVYSCNLVSRAQLPGGHFVWNNTKKHFYSPSYIAPPPSEISPPPIIYIYIVCNMYIICCYIIYYMLLSYILYVVILLI